jgi:hypothetical protein
MPLCYRKFVNDIAFRPGANDSQMPTMSVLYLRALPATSNVAVDGHVAEGGPHYDLEKIGRPSDYLRKQPVR